MTKEHRRLKAEDDGGARVDSAGDDHAVDGREDLRVPEVRARLVQLGRLRGDRRGLAVDVFAAAAPSCTLSES